MATRQQARTAVVGLLYAHQMGNEKVFNNPDDFLLKEKIKGKQNEFAKSLLAGIEKETEAIDEKIKANLTNWDFEKIGQVEKAILRLATYELIYSDLDNAVIINEALEITKKLADPTAPSFINGILDSIVKGKK
ncbi:MAG: transcription antitermination factor NusB [Campylobacterales bacterium]|nr:transcription antitermination factor NusB [Campylobacterales bacterium]